MKSLWVTLIAISMASSASAEHQAGLLLADVVTRVQQAQRDVQSLQCRFKEVVVLQGRTQETVRGLLRYQRPNHLRIDQRQPEKQVLLSDGQEVRLYTPAAGQVVTGLWKRWVIQSGFPIPLLSFVSDFPADQWSHRYTVLFGGYDQELYKLVFRPKQPEDTTVELWVSDESFLPKRGRLVSADQSIDVTFEDLVVNAPLPQGIFHLDVPKETVVVPMTL